MQNIEAISDKMTRCTRTRLLNLLRPRCGSWFSSVFMHTIASMGRRRFKLFEAHLGIPRLCWCRYRAATSSTRSTILVDHLMMSMRMLQFLVSAGRSSFGDGKLVRACDRVDIIDSNLLISRKLTSRMRMPRNAHSWRVACASWWCLSIYLLE